MILIVENINDIEIDENINDIEIDENNIPKKYIKNKYSKYEYYFLKKIINNFYKIDDFVIKYTINGKPFIENKNIYFSISHDNDILVICFDNKPIGIDIQFFNNNCSSIKSFMNLECNDEKEIVNIFSKKEAIIKLEGLTLKRINELEIYNYKIKTIMDEKYVINIASYKE